MKKVVVIILLSMCFVGCSKSKVINGKLYEPYGLFNEELKSNKIKYRVCKGNVVWACILSGTVAAPVYFVGFDLYEPMSIKTKTGEN